jgi:hypothetical protein
MIAPVDGSGDWPAWIARVARESGFCDAMGNDASMVKMDAGSRLHRIRNDEKENRPRAL